MAKRDRLSIPLFHYSTSVLHHSITPFLIMHGMMKAARLHGFERTHGSREVVRVDDDADSGDWRRRGIDSRARAGLNHGDLHMREDAVQYSPDVKTIPDLPMTIGHDGLGEIVEVSSMSKIFALAIASL